MTVVCEAAVCIMCVLHANPLLARITSDPAIFGGKSIIRGQRFAVEHLLGALGAGASEAEMLATQKRN